MKESLVLTKEVARYESAVKRNRGTNEEVRIRTVRIWLSTTGDSLSPFTSVALLWVEYGRLMP